MHGPNERSRQSLPIEVSVGFDVEEIVKDLGADSLDVVEMLMTMEEEFGIEIDEEDVELFKQHNIKLL